MSYRGWSNYETWAIKLWMDNEEGSYLYTQELAREVWDETEESSNFTREEEARWELASRIQGEYEEAMPEVEGVWSDLLRAAFSEVNWMEIASALLDDTVEEYEEDPQTMDTPSA